MTVIVLGHGVNPDETETFLPAGVQVRMYVQEDVALRADLGLLAALDAAGEPGEVITSSIKNYRLSALGDDIVAAWLTLAQDLGETVWLVGSDLPSELRLCESGEEVTCAGLGEHVCNGLLGRARELGETDIALIACRVSARSVVLPEQEEAEEHVATKYDDTTREIDEYRNWLWAGLTSGDPAQVAAAEERVDGLPAPSIALLSRDNYFRCWMQARWVKHCAEQNDLKQLFGQLQSNVRNVDVIMDILNKIPAYGKLLDDAAFGNPVIFWKWMDFLGEGDVIRSKLVARGRLADVWYLSDLNVVAKWDDHFRTLFYQGDDDRAEQDFDRFPTQIKARLVEYHALYRCWPLAQEATGYADRDELAELFAHLDRKILPLDPFMDCFSTITSCGESIDAVMERRSGQLLDVAKRYPEVMRALYRRDKIKDVYNLSGLFAHDSEEP